jgi:hypothetical protein
MEPFGGGKKMNWDFIWEKHFFLQKQEIFEMLLMDNVMIAIVDMRNAFVCL